MQDFSGMEFDDLFVCQKDDYSCGPACLATITRLYGVEPYKGYVFFRDQLSPKPEIGSDPKHMAEMSRIHLPFVNAGEYCYQGGIAVAYIIHTPSRDDHYAVFLAQHEGKIVYYDPYDHAVIVKNMADLEWKSNSGHMHQWTINYAPLAGNSFDLWQKFASRPWKLWGKG